MSQGVKVRPAIGEKAVLSPQYLKTVKTHSNGPSVVLKGFQQAQFMKKKKAFQKGEVGGLCEMGGWEEQVTLGREPSLLLGVARDSPHVTTLKI